MKSATESRRKRPITKIAKTFKLRSDLCEWLAAESDATGIKQTRLVENGIASERAARSMKNGHA